MAEEERACVRCGATQEIAHLERCAICQKWYCHDCSYRTTTGRRFCSETCARAYFYGDADDLENDFGPDEFSDD